MRLVAWGAVLGMLLGRAALGWGATLGSVPWHILVAQIPSGHLVLNVTLAGLGAVVARRRGALGSRPALVRSALSGYVVGFILALLANAVYYGVLVEHVSIRDESFTQMPTLFGMLSDGFALVGLGLGLVLGMVPLELFQRKSASSESSPNQQA